MNVKYKGNFFARLSAYGRVKDFLRRVKRRDLVISLALAAFLWSSGDGPPQRAQGSPHRPKPWFDAKGAFVFPLGTGPLPTTREQLIEALTQGWKTHIRFPEGGDIVQTNGGRYPALGKLQIDLDGGIVNPDRDEESDPVLKPSGKVEERLAVRDFNLDAQPLVSNKAKMSIHIAASDARLDLEHDDHGRPMMMLADAREASFSFEATQSDLERMLVNDLNEAGKNYGVTVSKARVRVTAVNNRAIDVDLHLSTRVAMIPAGMRFQAHVDIDNQMFAKLTRLDCEGDEALGPLIVGLIRPGLSKLQGKSRLVFSFPTGQLRLVDVIVQGGDDIKLAAKFAR